MNYMAPSMASRVYKEEEKRVSNCPKAVTLLSTKAIRHTFVQLL